MMNGSTTKAPAESPIQIVRKTEPTWPLSMTPSISSMSDPTTALIAVAGAIATSIQPICSRRSSWARRPIRRRSRIVATSASARFAAVTAIAVCTGERLSAESRSPMTTPGHQRRPPRYSTPTARPTGGQIAEIEPVNCSS